MVCIRQYALVELLDFLEAAFEFGQLLALFVTAPHVVVLYHIAGDATIALRRHVDLADLRNDCFG